MMHENIDYHEIEIKRCRKDQRRAESERLTYTQRQDYKAEWESGPMASIWVGVDNGA